MTLKRWLIALPLVVVAALAQSYFWVPTYEHQSTGNPARLSKYIDASIGDAEVLNPILNADTVSNQIVGLVFESLLDLDADLHLRGRIATDWGVTEEAYLLVNPERRFPDGTPVSGSALLRRIAEGRTSGELRALEGLVTAMRLLPPERRTETIELPPQGDAAPQKLGVTVEVPERLHFSLERVDQDFFGYLEPVLGPDYLAGFPYERHIRTEDPAALETIRPRFAEILPVAEHNPVILFHLRKGVRFHDGHEVTAEDVRFTYEAIMNPKNLSPRGSDFEPIKRVEVPDPYTVRVVYKRLYSPAINAWTMGILPAHLLSEEALKKEMAERGLSEAARAAFGMRDAGFNRAPIGAGPFRFVEWQSDERIHLKRNEDYWEGAPEYRDYYLRIIPDLLTQEVEFRTGAIDYYGALPHQVNRYLKDPKYQSFTSLAFAYSYIGYNLRRPLFQDARVRRALGMAIDVGEIIQYLLYGEGEQVTGPYAKDSDWYDPSVSPLPYDPAGARRLLEEVGFQSQCRGLARKGR